MNGQAETRAPIPVRVLSTSECGNTPPTVALVEMTAAGLGIRIDLSQVVLVNPEEAGRYRFHGSPTVQVNGLDIDPWMRESETFGFT